MEQSLFPHDLKLADVAPVYKNKSINKAFEDNFRCVSILSNISKVYKNASMIKFKPTLIKFYVNTNVDFVKVTDHNTV